MKLAAYLLFAAVLGVAVTWAVQGRSLITETQRLVTKTVVDEFVLPTFGWTRELAITPAATKVYFLETDKDRLGELDATTGAVPRR